MQTPSVVGHTRRFRRSFPTLAHTQWDLAMHVYTLSVTQYLELAQCEKLRTLLCILLHANSSSDTDEENSFAFWFRYSSSCTSKLRRSTCFHLFRNNEERYDDNCRASFPLLFGNSVNNHHGMALLIILVLRTNVAVQHHGDLSGCLYSAMWSFFFIFDLSSNCSICFSANALSRIQFHRPAMQPHPPY